jgi:hypothetical protein
MGPLRIFHLCRYTHTHTHTHTQPCTVHEIKILRNYKLYDIYVVNKNIYELYWLVN